MLLRKMKKPRHEEQISESEESSFDEEEDLDPSDEALQKAFAAGKLKPGLVVLNKSGEAPQKAVAINDVAMLQLHRDKIKLPSKFGWIERLDIVNDVAPLAPEIAIQLDQHKGKRSREIKMINSQRKSKGTPNPSLKSVDEDPVHNDFVREMGFYRQAQEAVLKCLPRLRAMGVPTKRPDDYFAEMAKSDTHMQKVAQVLLKKQTATERAEKVRKIREQKKFSKQTQVQVIQERQKAKKEMIESVKKYRKDHKGNLDFLDDRKSGKDAAKNKSNGRADEKRINRRRQNKNDKYGYGGKKKGSKWNTRDSLDNFDDAGGKKKGSSKGREFGRGKPMGRGGGGGGKPMGGGGGSKRPGKNNRQKIKARKN